MFTFVSIFLVLLLLCFCLLFILILLYIKSTKKFIEFIGVFILVIIGATTGILPIINDIQKKIM